MDPVSSLAVGRFMRLPRRATDTWQGGLVRLPVWIDETGGEPRRPWGGVWVSLESGMVGMQLGAGADWTLALEAMIDLGLKFTRGRPARLQVTDAALGARLVAALGDRDLAVSVVTALPDALARVREFAEASRGAPVPPDALGGRGVTVERMRTFAEAAREFHAAAPWRRLCDADLIHVETPAAGRGLEYLSVLGGAGHTFGLGFFADTADFEAVQQGPDPHDTPESFLAGGRWSLYYGPKWELPFGDVDLWEDHGLPVAGDAAYPVAIWFGPDRRMRRPEARELSYLEAILRVLAASTESEIDRGRWSRTVSTADGPCLVTLAIPELLLPLDAPLPRRGPVDRRLAERVLLESERFLARHPFADPEAASRALRERFAGPIDDIPSTATTPLEKAQDVVFRAFEARGRRRLLLARQALELSADCADAYGILAEEAPDPAEALRLYAEGVAAGERALGPETFRAHSGEFWRMVRTRPYMRVRFALAQALDVAGRRAEAIEHYAALLGLDPGDHQGTRHVLLVALLLADRDEEAGRLLQQYGEDPTALWGYGRALWTFRREGDSAAARRCLDQALRLNRHVPAYLAGDAQWDGPDPVAGSPASREEAVIVADEQGDAWTRTPGAEDWLRGRASRRPGDKRRRRQR
jgi:tetratricopeptide (TPR) repeat protein